MNNLHERIAEHLGWTTEEVQSFSLYSLRDFVKNQKIKHEISCIIREGHNIPYETLKN